jgi:hypothetical protein
MTKGSLGFAEPSCHHPLTREITGYQVVATNKIRDCLLNSYYLLTDRKPTERRDAGLLPFLVSATCIETQEPVDWSLDVHVSMGNNV